MNRLLILFLVFAFACNTPSTPEESTDNSADHAANAEEQNDTEQAEEAATRDSTLSLVAGNSAELKSFVPAGYEILGFEYGDLNKDELTTDALIALKVIGKEEAESTRPLLVLTRQADGSLKQVAQNDYVVYCADCGGVMGDPFQGLVIKDGYFSVEHFGGSRWKWLNVTTFKYDPAIDNWLLHRFGSESYDGFKPDSVVISSKTKKDFGQLLFKDYVDVN